MNNKNVFSDSEKKFKNIFNDNEKKFKKQKTIQKKKQQKNKFNRLNLTFNLLREE